MTNPSIWTPGQAVSAESSNRVQTFIASLGQTDFTITNFTYEVGTNSLEVDVSGVNQRPGIDFIETGSNSFSLTSPIEEIGTSVFVRGLVDVHGNPQVVSDASNVSYKTETVKTALDARLPEISSYADLRAYAGELTAVYVRCVASIFDGGAGVFRVDAADMTTADNGGTILVDASGRRWKREFAGPVNVRWFGAVGDGVTDDTAAIQAAVDSSFNVIYIPEGTYKISNTILINSSLEIVGAGSSNCIIVNATTNDDAIHFETTTTGHYEYLAECGLSGVTIKRTTEASANTGAGLRLTRIEKSIFRDIKLINNPEGLTVLGGQFNRFYGIYSHYWYTNTDVSARAAITLSESPTDGATYQPVYTSSFTDCICGGGYVMSCLAVNSADGVFFSNSYLSGGKTQNILFKINNSYISACDFSNTYVDGGNWAVSTASGVVCDVSGTQSIRVKFSNCDFANFGYYGIQISDRVNQLQLSNCEIFNCDVAGIYSSAGGGARIQVTNTHIHDTVTGISIASAGLLNISNCSFLTLTSGIIASGTVSRLVLTGNIFMSVTTEKNITATTTTKINPGVVTSFTPTLSFNGTQVTYTSRTGHYSTSADGSYVIFSAHIVYSAKGAGVGNISIGGLPIAPNQISSVSAMATTTATTGVFARAITTGEIILYKGSGSGPTVLADTDFSSSGYISLGGVYKIA